MLEGVAERHFQDYVIAGEPGEVWLCTMWEPHGRRVVSRHQENVVLQFVPEFLGEEMVGDKLWLIPFAVPPRDRPWVKTDEVRAQVLQIGREMREEIEAKRRSWVFALRLQLLRLLFVLSRDWEPAPPSAARAGGAAANLNRIMPALAMVRDLREPRARLPEAARRCGLSPSRFAVLFRQMMGVPFARFALRARLAYAAQRLVATDLPIERIAEETGFADASHLHRHFVKQYGQTPRRYRDRPGCGSEPGLAD